MRPKYGQYPQPKGETAREELHKIKTGTDLFCMPLKEKTQPTRYSKYGMFKVNHKGGRMEELQDWQNHRGKNQLVSSSNSKEKKKSVTKRDEQ